MLIRIGRPHELPPLKTIHADWPGYRHVLLTEQFLPLPPEVVFPFFADAANLNLLTPPWLHFRILTPLPISMHRDARIDYSIRLRIVPMRWQTSITTWNPPHGFVDQQVKGPYALWHHEHLFLPKDGGTLMTDRVDYALALGSLWPTRAIHAAIVKPDLRRIFAYRRAAMDRHFGVQERPA